MVYVISIGSDSSTSDILEWLFKLGKEFSRIDNLADAQKELDFFPVKISNYNLNNIGSNRNNRELSSVWVRRIGGFDDIPNSHLQRFYRNELKTLAEFVFRYETHYRKIVGVPDTNRSFNKLEMLSIANKYKLLIPSTVITNSKYDILAFYKEHERVINKAISEPFRGKLMRKELFGYTKLLNKRFISSLPDIFPSMLFQQYIEKEYEIRIFYLDGKLYPMAIFSQGSKKTMVDFRNYDSVMPNRTVPCKLPKNVEEKLVSFMKDHKLDAASVDMVKCKSTGNYYFLEVNSHGQFGMVSEPCNYYLEKKIAKIL